MLPRTEEASEAGPQMKNSFHVLPESKRIITRLLIGHLMFEVRRGPVGYVLCLVLRCGHDHIPDSLQRIEIGR